MVFRRVGGIKFGLGAFLNVQVGHLPSNFGARRMHPNPREIPDTRLDGSLRPSDDLEAHLLSRRCAGNIDIAEFLGAADASGIVIYSPLL
jgi:hypothetical protein